MNGASNLIDFSQLGGYRLEQPTFEKMQSTYYLFLKAMIAHFNIPDVGNFIIGGCTIDGENITEGIMYIDGVVCPFETTPGTLATKIKRQVTTQSLAFENGTTPVVFQKYTAIVDASGTALSEFVRVPSPFNLPANIVIDSDYVHTDNNYTDEEKAKLEGIEAEAEKNVQTDWNENNATSDAYIKNKPNIQNILKSNSVLIGDISDNVDYPISFPDVGTTNYYVEVFHECTVNSGNTVTNTSVVNAPLVHSKTSNSFKIRYRDPIMSVQGLRIYYNIVAL